MSPSNLRAFEQIVAMWLDQERDGVRGCQGSGRKTHRQGNGESGEVVEVGNGFSRKKHKLGFGGV